MGIFSRRCERKFRSRDELEVIEVFQMPSRDHSVVEFFVVLVQIVSELFEIVE